MVPSFIGGMDPVAGKALAASAGATLTALTMTPFDVVKTRLQTQPMSNIPGKTPLQSCLQTPEASCSRSAAPLSSPLASTSATKRRTMTTAAWQNPATSGGVNYFRSNTPLEAFGRNKLPAEVCICVLEGGALKAQRVRGFWDGLYTVARHEGIRGLWKGLGTTLLIAVPSQSAYMLTYDYLLNKAMPRISPHDSITPLLAGISARTAVSSIASPLEMLRTSLQSTPLDPSRPHNLSTVLTAARELVQKQGVQSLWRGLVPTLWRDVPFSGVYWAGYEAWKRHFTNTYPSLSTPVVAFSSGAISGMTAAILTHPFDVAKTRRQTLLLSQDGVRGDIVGFLRALVRNEGVGALFAGITPRLAKIAPACGIMIASYETVGKALIKHD